MANSSKNSVYSTVVDDSVVEAPAKRTRKPIAAGLGVIRATLADSTVAALEAKEESSKLERNVIVETALVLFLELSTVEQRKEALKKVRALHVKNEEDNI